MSSDNERFRNMLLTNPSGAVAYLYDMYYETLFHYACMVTKDEENSKDIVQEAILHIWTNRKEFGNGHLKSIEHYLVKIVRSKSLSYFRKAAHIDIDELPLSKHPLDYTAEMAIVETEILQQIRDVISTFPKKEQECLLLKIDSGMSLDEIAVHQNVTRKAVEARITSANKRLRKWASDSNFP